MVKITYKPGDKVFAKVKGYPPWPAQVVGDTGKKKYNVLFYGTQETGAIKPEDLSYYLKYKDSYVHKYLKRAGYDDAVKQIEEAIKKDGGDGNDGSSLEDSVQDPEVSDASSVSSASDKKTLKRKVVSLPADESSIKKSPHKGRRRSIATADSKEINSEEPAARKPRRRSNTSTEENSEEPIAKKPRRKSNASSESKNEDKEGSKKANDNGIKEETPELIKDKAEEAMQIDEAEVTEEPGSVSKPEESASTSETVTVEVENKEDESRGENNEENSAKKVGTEATGSGQPKEPEFVEIQTTMDENMQIEEEPSEITEKTTIKELVKVEIVTEQSLNNNILYAEHVKKNVNLFNNRPVEARQDNKDDVLAAKLPSGTICGVKLHKEWPLEHSNEYDRALYDETVAKLTLEERDLLSSGKKALHEVEANVIPDIEMSLEDVKEISYARDIESKRKRLDRLKVEADLVTWDSKIKNHLGLDKALPDAALESLKEFNKIQKDLDALMFKKHPHVLDTVRRLRKYVGNIKEWDMADQDVDSFTKKAEKIRIEAEKIYNKIKNVVKIQEEKGTFWDSFMDLVAEFRTKCKDSSESEILVLCAEPDSRQAFFDKLDEVTGSEGAGINSSNTSEPVLKETSVQGWSEKK